MLTRTELIEKRVFDFCLALTGIIFTLPIIIIAWLAATLETRSNGFFTQIRIGKEGKPFKVIKIKTMRPLAGLQTTVTTSQDRRITQSGALFRKTKIDELPQLWNVLTGTMSLVGPRPDVPGFADRLEGEDREILQTPPGITGPASIKYKNEEEILAAQEDPERYSREVIWPDKVRINRAYLKNWSLAQDIACIKKTIVGS